MIDIVICLGNGLSHRQQRGEVWLGDVERVLLLELIVVGIWIIIIIIVDVVIIFFYFSIIFAIMIFQIEVMFIIGVDIAIIVVIGVVDKGIGLVGGNIGRLI